MFRGHKWSIGELDTLARSYVVIEKRDHSEFPVDLSESPNCLVSSERLRRMTRRLT